MHPVIALALVVGAIACLAGGGWADIALVGLAAILWSRWVPGLSLRHLGRTIRRLRYFYLSLLLLYGWFSPGEPAMPALGAYSPSIDGVLKAARYIAVLMAITSLVQLLMAAYSRETLVAGLRWWLRPLRAVRLDPDRVALRLMLVVEVLPRLRVLASSPGGAPASGRGPTAVAQRAAVIFERTLAEAERETPPRLALPALAAPAPGEWIAAAGALAVLVAL